MTCAEIQDIADMIRTRTGLPRVRIVLEGEDGNTLTVESVERPERK